MTGGLSNIAYLDAVHLATPHLCAAHCVWVDADEQRLLAARDVKVLHCPGSNLKLGSGLAPVVEMRRQGITVSLGADGAACNNRLDMFEEMRLAAGLEHEIGSIEVGKKADLIRVRRHQLHHAPDVDPYSTLVYAARGSDVRTTIVDGAILVDDGEPTRVSRAEVAAAAAVAARALAARAGV